MKFLLTAGAILAPSLAFAAAGGTGEGFGPDDWISKWPVLLIVFGSVAGMTGFLTMRIRARKKTVRAS